jgi:two-component system, NtrC family, nitrogen regulation sensor histidine kinase NtrY
LERRLFVWMLVLVLVPTLVLVIGGGWAVGRSLALAGAVGPWEEVAESGREVIRLAEPGADPALQDAIAAHRAELSESLTQARRWAFVGDQFLAALPWLVLITALVLAGVAALASRLLARQLAKPIEELVVVAGRMGRGEPLPAEPESTIREVRVLDHALRDAASRLAEARERAVTAERMRVWGEMARRVAHEMKNPLTPLRLAAHRLARSSPPAEVADVIAQEVGRLEELAAQFSELGRPPEGPATVVDLGDLLAGLLETDVPPGVRVRLDAPAELPPVRARYDALLRAFRNLVRNAVEAMDGTPAPELTVRVSTEARPDGGAEWVEARIQDNGVGLPPDGPARIFEPDFTTKARGTGLGLALVRQAIEADGGSVEARRLDRGTELVVRLPSTTSDRSAHETSAR